MLLIDINAGTTLQDSNKHKSGSVMRRQTMQDTQRDFSMYTRIKNDISGIIAAGVFGSLLFVGTVSSANAQDEAIGEALYAEACSVCHGSGGMGDGEFAQYLTVKPSNLTTIAKESTGGFPFLEIMHIVDGRTGVRGHGGAQMPIWGNVFSRQVGDDSGPFGAELYIRARIVSLIDYIESMQVE